MTFELLTYFLLICFSLLFSFESSKVKVSYIFAIGLVFIYMISVRLSGFDVDFKVYNTTLKFPVYVFFTSSYFLKEPVYWIGSKLLYLILNNEVIVYLIYDCLILLLVYKAVKNLKLPAYFLLFYFVFFPNMLGLQNIYRQFIATGIFFYCFSLSFLPKTNVKKFIIFVFAAFTHNVVFLFFPLLFIRSKTKFGKICYWLSSLGSIVVLPLFVGTKSNTETGLNLSYVYFALIVLYILIFISIQAYKITKKNSYYYLIAIHTFLLMITVLLLLGSSQSERTGMIILVLLTAILFKMTEENFKNIVLVRIIYILILILPTFLFNSAFRFLQTDL